MAFFARRHITPRTSYFICSGLRTGSTLLCQMLTQTGIAGAPTEYFNLFPLVKQTRYAYFSIQKESEALHKIITGSMTPNGVFGTKLIFAQLSELLEKIILEQRIPITSDAEMVASRFPNPRYIWLRRKNRVRQAISLYRAKESRVWWNFKEGPPPLHEPVHAPLEEPEFDFAAIEDCLRQNQYGESMWKSYFARNKINPLSLTYEDMTNDLTGTLNEVLAYIGLPQVTHDVVPPMDRQADAKTDEWEKRFTEMQLAKTPASKQRLRASERTFTSQDVDAAHVA